MAAKKWTSLSAEEQAAILQKVEEGTELTKTEAAQHAQYLAAQSGDEEDKQFKFITPAFIHNGVTYKSEELEALIEAEDETTLALVPELIKLGQIVEVEPSAPEGE
jgi:TRAP-type C4-dicarboxylate transport system substrate-binding protein